LCVPPNPLDTSFVKDWVRKHGDLLTPDMKASWKTWLDEIHSTVSVTCEVWVSIDTDVQVCLKYRAEFSVVISERESEETKRYTI